MAERITAYRGDDGQIYSTREEAEKAELTAAVDHIANCDKSHLSNVAHGHSGCEETRNALRLIASRLPLKTLPVAEVA